MSVITLQTAPVQQQTRHSVRFGLGLFFLWNKRRCYRAMLRNELLLQPESVLADAGLTRAAAEREAQKPFWRA